MLWALRGFNKPSEPEDWTPLTILILDMKNGAFSRGQPGLFLCLIFLSLLSLLGNFSWGYLVTGERSALRIKHHKCPQHAGTKGRLTMFRVIILWRQNINYVMLPVRCDTCLWCWLCCQGQWPMSIEHVLFQASFLRFCMNCSLGPQTHLQRWVMEAPHATLEETKSHLISLIFCFIHRPRASEHQLGEAGWVFGDWWTFHSRHQL